MSNSVQKKKKGTICIIIGLLLIAAALFLAYNNISQERLAREASTSSLEQLNSRVKEGEKVVPDYEEFPEMEMPQEEIDGQSYIGILEIPALELSLPVISDWSYPKLKIAPCRYEGSAYTNDLIIAAHNYNCHFGYLKSLQMEETVIFTDLDGNVFHYEVAELEILEPFAVEDMKSGDWDLTLFTCTYGGQQRVTVRCVIVE